MDANIAVLEVLMGAGLAHYLGIGKARTSGFKTQLPEREITGPG
jgi:hypothetical protein